ncbi:centromere protein J-like [Oncorhynchus keta]|uniref:centromere protein J-like n=1 Tax=Oncorhynchus keta TaxID=8018 RepID=UPI00227D0F30|nr:centromere protein J-like [Oncorhynchus keta]
MSSPAGLQAQQCQTNFLSRWMPSSSCVGVILNHSLDLAESLRHSSVWGSRDVDDSFASQFLCPCVHFLVHDAESGTELNKQNQRPGDRPGEMDSMEKLVKQSQDLPLILEQLRQWQQHMQEQLKAHQLEELVHLQEEQQRLLGMVHVAQQDGADYIETSRLTGADWRGNSIGGRPLPQSSPTAQSFPIGPRLPSFGERGLPSNNLQGARSRRERIRTKHWGQKHGAVHTNIS